MSACIYQLSQKPFTIAAQRLRAHRERGMCMHVEEVLYSLHGVILF